MKPTGIIFTMEDYFDEICLLVLCCLSLVTQPANPFAIAGLLGAIFLVCLSSSTKPAPRLIAQGAYLVAACVSTTFLSFLPVATYVLMHEHPWIVRLSWLIPSALAVLTRPVDVVGLITVGTLSAVASAMAIRDVRFLAERTDIIDTCDELRERNRALHTTASLSAVDANATAALNTAEGLSTPATLSDEVTSNTAAFDDLTKREAAIVQLVAEGLDNREIANQLFLSEGTVRNHISTILSKKELHNRTQIAIMYYRGQ